MRSKKAKGYKCKPQRRFRSEPVVKRGMEERLSKISIMCTSSDVAFEVRYSNGSLCVCGSIGSHMREQKHCQEKLSSLDIIINASTNSIRNGYRDRCDISLHFEPFTDSVFQPINIYLTQTQTEKSSATGLRSCGGSAISSCEPLPKKKSTVEAQQITRSVH